MSIFSNLFKKRNEERQVNNEHIKTENNIKNNKENEENKENEDEITAVISAVIESMNEEEETVAAITAAIACMLGKSTDEFIVRTIRRTSEIDSLWALNGRMKLMR